MFVCVTFSSKTGKVKREVEGQLKSMLKMYALQNTKANQISIVYEEETGVITAWLEGVANSIPKVMDFMVGSTLAEAGVEFVK